MFFMALILPEKIGMFFDNLFLAFVVIYAVLFVPLVPILKSLNSKTGIDLLGSDWWGIYLPGGAGFIVMAIFYIAIIFGLERIRKHFKRQKLDE